MHISSRSRKASLGLAAVSLAAGTAMSTFLPAQAQESGTLTNFGFDATAYGSETQGNDQADSDRTALIHLPCTRYVPRDRFNHQANGGDADTAQVENVDTHNFTRKSTDGTVSAFSTVKIQGGTLAGGAVMFTDLRAVNRSLRAKGSGFGVRQSSSVGSLVVNGAPVPFPAGSQSATIPVPGQGDLVLNERIKRTNGTSAFGLINVLKFIDTDGSIQRVGHAESRIDSDIEGGMFHGGAFASQGRTEDGTVTTRKGAYQPMPCLGTQGEILESSTGEAESATSFLGARRSFAFGVVRDNGTRAGYTRSVVDVAKFGVLELRNVKGRANVLRKENNEVTRNAKGTSVGDIFIAGERQEQPPAGEPQPFPGGEFTIRIVDRIPAGIEAIGAEVRLFNGTPANRSDDSIVDLARAKLSINKKK